VPETTSVNIMAQDKSAVDMFLEENGSDTITPQEQNPFADLKVEQEEVVVAKEEEEEKPLPFNKDPKIQRFIQKEVERLTKDLSPKEAREFKEEVKESDFVSAMEAILGNDTPEKVNALNLLKRTVDDLRTEARSAKEMLEAERRADEQAERELTQGFENIEETFNVDFNTNKKLRSEFAEFIERVAPKDENGEIIDYPDFTETFKVFQELRQKPQNTRAKELASRSMTRGGEASKVEIPTDTSWKGVDKLFATFRGQ